MNNVETYSISGIAVTLTFVTFLMLGFMVFWEKHREWEHTKARTEKMRAEAKMAEAEEDLQRAIVQIVTERLFVNDDEPFDQYDVFVPAHAEAEDEDQPFDQDEATRKWALDLVTREGFGDKTPECFVCGDTPDKFDQGPMQFFCAECHGDYKVWLRAHPRLTGEDYTRFILDTRSDEATYNADHQPSGLNPLV